jgi:hypothetical protein
LCHCLSFASTPAFFATVTRELPLATPLLAASISIVSITPPKEYSIPNFLAHFSKVFVSNSALWAIKIASFPINSANLRS